MHLLLQWLESNRRLKLESRAEKGHHGCCMLHSCQSHWRSCSNFQCSCQKASCTDLLWDNSRSSGRCAHGQSLGPLFGVLVLFRWSRVARRKCGHPCLHIRMPVLFLESLGALCPVALCRTRSSIQSLSIGGCRQGMHVWVGSLRVTNGAALVWTGADGG